MEFTNFKITAIMDLQTEIDRLKAELELKKQCLAKARVRSTRTKGLEFIKEHGDEIRNIYLEQHAKRIQGSDVLPCTFKGDICIITPKDMLIHDIPSGVRGGKIRRGGKPNFFVYFKGLALTGPRLKLSSKIVNFEDPRDCAEIIRKISQI